MILIFLWCLLHTDYSRATLISGAVASFTTVLVLHFLFFKQSNIKNYRISPIILSIFVIRLFINIYISTYQVIKVIFTGAINPTVVEFKTSVHNHWYQCLVANAITLTPGTVTIEKNDHHLTVLWLSPTSHKAKEQSQIIQGDFEDILLKGERF